MQKLTTRLLVTSLLLVVLISCKSYQIEGVTKVASATTNFQNLYFQTQKPIMCIKHILKCMEMI